MNAALFFGLTSAAAIAAVVAELVYAWKTEKRWYGAVDTAANFNLAAGNVLLGAFVAVWIAFGYEALYAWRVWDAFALIPGWLGFAAAVIAADFLQYWNHRLSHNWNLLWWGHVTHHSSGFFNLSTGVRISWVYRAYAWLLYAPMPLLGFPFEAFVFGQVVINVYNLFMHTRWATDFGPLRMVLVTPLAHRMHHSADPARFGNYGAALIVWDRLFGTYVPAVSGAERETLPFGIDRNVESPNPLVMNFHYLAELRRQAKRQGASMFRLLLARPSMNEPETAARDEACVGRRALSVSAFLPLVLIAVVALSVNQSQPYVGRYWSAFALVLGLGLVIGYGMWLSNRSLLSRSPALPVHSSADR